MRTINVGFLKKNPKELSFDLLTWRTIETLLHQNRPFADCLRLIRNKDNQDLVAYILRKLDSGVSIETIIQSLTKDSVCRQLSFYASFIPLAESLTTSLDVIHFENEMKKKLSKVFVYPCFLILFSSLVLFLFSYLILPSLVSMLDLQDVFLLNMVSLINRILVIFYVIILLLIVLFLLFKRNKLVYMWSILHKLHLDILLQKYVTYLFSQYLLILMEHGVSTKRSMEILKGFYDKPLIQFVASSLHEQLMAGDSFDEILHNEYLDTTFCMICNLGYQTNSFVLALKEYKEVIEMWIMDLMKKVSIIVQIVAYGFIGVIVVVVYQIMLLPLSLFEMM